MLLAQAVVVGATWAAGSFLGAIGSAAVALVGVAAGWTPAFTRGVFMANYAEQRDIADDETLRDGLQSPSVIDPPLDVKVRLLHLMNRLGIETADIGLPGSGPRQRQAVETLCREISDNGLRIRANCAARTMVVDIQPIADVVQQTGVPIEACVFIGSSPIRQYAEEWGLSRILRFTTEAVEFAVGEGLEVMYVTEDTIRAAPDDLRQLLAAAVESGASLVARAPVPPARGGSVARPEGQQDKFPPENCEAMTAIGFDVFLDVKLHATIACEIGLGPRVGDQGTSLSKALRYEALATDAPLGRQVAQDGLSAPS